MQLTIWKEIFNPGCPRKWSFLEAIIGFSVIHIYLPPSTCSCSDVLIILIRYYIQSSFVQHILNTACPRVMRDWLNDSKHEAISLSPLKLPSWCDWDNFAAPLKDYVLPQRESHRYNTVWQIPYNTNISYNTLKYQLWHPNLF